MNQLNINSDYFIITLAVAVGILVFVIDFTEMWLKIDFSYTRAKYLKIVIVETIVIGVLWFFINLFKENLIYLIRVLNNTIKILFFSSLQGSPILMIIPMTSLVVVSLSLREILAEEDVKSTYERIEMMNTIGETNKNSNKTTTVKNSLKLSAIVLVYGVIISVSLCWILIIMLFFLIR